MDDRRADDPIAAWDAEAELFDDAADHGLRDPATRQAWRSLLLPLVGRTPQVVADLGCGTGHRVEADVRMLADAALWGRPVTDERYVVLSAR